MGRYEQNTETLLAFLEKGEPRAPELMARFQGSAIEEERVELLKRLFLMEMETYETIPLWENPETGEMVIPDWHTEEAYGLQLPPQIAFFPVPEDIAKEQGVPAGGGRGTVLVSPGGGYNCICSLSEGTPVIGYFLKKGYSCALLSYRVKPYLQYTSVADIKRAVRMLRYRAEELGIRADRIAVHGGSAGGNLSALCAVHFDYGSPEAADPVERMSSRPDAALISYGAFSQVLFSSGGKSFIHVRENQEELEQEGGLTSPLSDKLQKDLYYFSPEKHVTPETPPFFFWQLGDMDDPRYVYNFAKELADAGVRTEVHIFPYGPHGTALCGGSGMGYRDLHSMHWAELAAEWLELVFEGKTVL